MGTKISKFPFEGTKEQEAELISAMNERKNEKVVLMPVLQKAQGIYGYLPIEVQKIISEYLNIPLAEIYGVVTFYSQFSLEPKGKNVVAVCMGTACYVRGAGKVLDKFSEELGIRPEETTKNREFTLIASRCIGACGLAPVLTINDKVYGKVKVEDISGLIAKYKAE